MSKIIIKYTTTNLLVYVAEAIKKIITLATILKKNNVASYIKKTI